MAQITKQHLGSQLSDYVREHLIDVIKNQNNFFFNFLIEDSTPQQLLSHMGWILNIQMKFDKDLEFDTFCLGEIKKLEQYMQDKIK